MAKWLFFHLVTAHKHPTAHSMHECISSQLWDCEEPEQGFKEANCHGTNLVNYFIYIMLLCFGVFNSSSKCCQNTMPSFLKDG